MEENYAMYFRFIFIDRYGKERRIRIGVDNEQDARDVFALSYINARDVRVEDVTEIVKNNGYSW